MPQTKVLVLTNIMPPYRVPLYRTLHEQAHLDLMVTLLGQSEANRHWNMDLGDIGFHCSYLSGRSLYLWRWELPIHLNYGLIGTLENERPDVVVISGWDQAAYWQAAWWCRRTGTPFVLQNESSLLSASRTRGPWMVPKRLMIRLASTYVAYGSKARDYLLRLGAFADRIHTGLNTVDVEALAEAVRRERANPNFQKLRARYPRVMFLYVGQLIPRKRVDLLLHAIKQLGANDVGVLVVGSGPEEERLRTLASSLGVRNVFFEGFHQPEELPRYYALADALVLQSEREVWGLVVNEALAAGLYVVCSDHVGAGFDLIRPGWNGDVFSSGDPTDLMIHLKYVRSSIDQVAKRREDIMADALARFGIDQLASALQDAIFQAVYSSWKNWLNREDGSSHSGVDQQTPGKT